jgi:arginine/lysine/ornithine decarboxylase
MPKPSRPAAVVALARGATSEEAARESGVSGRTVRRWMEDPDFQIEVRDTRTEILSTAVGQLAAGAAEAVTTLRAALRDADGRNRVQAARTLLDAVLSLRESLDLEQRLAALESAKQAEGGHRR